MFPFDSRDECPQLNSVEDDVACIIGQVLLGGGGATPGADRARAGREQAGAGVVRVDAQVGGRHHAVGPDR